jgi:GTP 3',8-cyclase
VRGDASDEDIREAIGRIWSRRSDRYSEIRSANTSDLEKVEMSYIGG